MEQTSRENVGGEVIPSSEKKYTVTSACFQTEDIGKIFMTLEKLRKSDTNILYFDQIEAKENNLHDCRYKLTSSSDLLIDNMEDILSKSTDNNLDEMDDIFVLRHRNGSISALPNPEVEHTSTVSLSNQNNTHTANYHTSSSDVETDEQHHGELNEFDVEEIDDIEKFNPDPRKLIQIRRHVDILNDRLMKLRKNCKHMDNRKLRKQVSSRISQLRKNAAYQENKIKLKGLILERDRLHYYIEKTKRFISKEDVTNDEKNYLLEKINMTLNDRIAGNFDTFIESVIKQTITNEKQT